MSDLLTLEAVSKSFDGAAAVIEVSFTVPAGSRVALVGSGGAGKTTLLELIAGARRPDQGRIRFDGRDIAGLPPDRVAALGIARTFDPSRPFAALSVEDNVIAGALLRERVVAEARRQALDLLEALGLAPLRHRPAASLQPIERKTLELARALATRPRLLLLDELLAGAYPDEAAALVETLRTLAGRDGLTLLLAEHDHHTVAALADRVLTLEHGSLAPDSGALPPAPDSGAGGKTSP